MTPVWVGLRVLEVRHRAVFYGGRCDGVMDSVRDFDLLGESVPQVRVSARTLALRGFFIIIYISAAGSSLGAYSCHLWIFHHYLF